MGKDNKITVWMGGKKTTLKRDDHADESYSLKEFNKDYSAATLENTTGDEVPTFVRRHSDESNNEQYFGQKSRFSVFKPIILASVSAIIIGSILGFFMLNMFVDIDKGLSQQNYTVPAAVDDEEANKEDSDNESASDEVISSTPIQSVDAFVLQAGKFEGETNANEMKSKFNQAGFSAMIWNKENYYYVLAGIASSKNQANQLAKEFNDHQLEVFVKNWNTESSDMKLTDDEVSWYKSYNKQWTESLISLSKDEKLSEDGWANIVNTIPDDSENIGKFTAFLEKEVSDLVKANKWEEQQLLLNLWYQFNLLVN
ncbi:SPOR domain-containing protein [Virgibacillus sp. JSM 102003]|uniref:SPOR domain-containing protein n=1 Tax=Virgibacillus sp. JSM 102003 TaxID=1562108 RepID=UPI0035BF5CBF